MSRRLLLALLALTGLLAMHGITASTASAALPCGQAPVHAQGHESVHAAGHGAPSHSVHGVDEASDAVRATEVQVASLAGGHGDPSHAAMLCLAVLTLVLLLGFRRTALLTAHAEHARHDGPAVRRSGSRAPPDDRQSLLCTWRT